MTTEQFKIFWTTTYPDGILISHSFRHIYNDRWFRIHSLPKSKRYAENKKEWTLLFDRQNGIITDLLGNNSKFILVTGDYYYEGVKENYPISKTKSISDIQFFPLEHINLHQQSPDEYEEGQVYRPLFSEQIWAPNKFNDLLKEIADDELRAFFISKENNCIIAPYDGGIDVILKDSKTRDNFKEKYKNFLSARQDGL